MSKHNANAKTWTGNTHKVRRGKLLTMGNNMFLLFLLCSWLVICRVGTKCQMMQVISPSA